MFYIIEEGCFSPRDKTIGWRPWAQNTDKAQAIEDAKLLKLSRVLECTEVWISKEVRRAAVHR